MVLVSALDNSLPIPALTDDLDPTPMMLLAVLSAVLSDVLTKPMQSEHHPNSPMAPLRLREVST
jgi:hypothetical protein